MDTAERYIRLSQLLAAAPEKPAETNFRDLQKWYGEIFAIVSEMGWEADAQKIAIVSSGVFDSELGGVASFWNVLGILYRAHAVAELSAPMQLKGSFIAAQAPLDAMAAVSRVLREATQSVLLVDPYMDELVLTDFCSAPDEHISIELLTDAHYVRPSFAPAVARWKAQFPATRPLAAKKTEPRVLHDRLIILDRKLVYVVSQSFKDLAKRSPATIARLEGEASTLKMDAYQAFWDIAHEVR